MEKVNLNYSGKRLLGALVALGCGWLLALALLLAWSGIHPRAMAQPQPPPAKDAAESPDRLASGRISMPIDRNARRKLDSVKEYVAKEQWGEAVQVLQSLLNKTEETFVEDEKKRRVSVWAEADRMLATLPRDGQEHYELQFGGEARAMLKRARATGEASLLAEIEHRFKHTEAGLEAAILRGSYHLDRGEYVLAALCYERLLQRPGVANKLNCLTLFKATLAFERAGDLKNRDRVWPELIRKLDQGGDNSLPTALARMRPEQLRELARARDDGRQQRLRLDWPVYLGSVERLCQSEGGTPFLEPRFAMNTLLKLPAEDDKDRAANNKIRDDWVVRAIKKVEQNGAVLSGFHPIAIGDLLIFRSYRGVHVVDARKAEELWPEAMPTKMSLYQLAREPAGRDLINGWVTKYLGQEGAPSIFYDNTMLGTLSTDHQNVYVVEDLAIPPTPEYLQEFNTRRVGQDGSLPGEWMEHNVLTAFDLAREGKVAWSIGEEQGKEPFGGMFFLGPPLPVAGKLYVLAEVRREIQLLCLEHVPMRGPNELAFPRLVWSKMLCNADRELAVDPIRRTQAVQLAYGDGILVCPTHAGAVFGVDLLTRTNVWAHSYLDGSQTPVIHGQLPVLPGRGWRGRDNYPIRPIVQATWASSAPVISDGMVAFTAPDGNSIHCLNLRDGSLVWERPRGLADLYLAGIYRGKVLVVGKDQIIAYHLKDGSLAWKTDTGIPSGRGVANDKVYFLPQRTGEIWAIDVEKGTVLGRNRSPHGEVPGNLIFHAGDVISQTTTGITIFPQLAVKEKEIDERLAKNPSDPTGLLSRGELRLHKGDLVAAVSDLHAVLANQPTEELRARTRLKLYEALSDLLERDFAANEKYLEEYQELAKLPVPEEENEERRAQREAAQRERTARILRLVARGREEQGRFKEALQAYVDFAASGGDRLVTLPEDPTTSALPRVWAQGRISAMLERAEGSQRQALEDALQEHYRQVESAGNIEAWKNFVGLFGSVCDLGRKARLRLAELYAERQEFAEAELELHVASRRADSPLAAQALDALGRLRVKRGQLIDAAKAYRELAQRFPNVVVRDGKTGQEIWLELWTDKRFLPYLEDMRRGWLSTLPILAVQRPPADFRNLLQGAWIEPGPEVPQAFRQHYVNVDASGTRFQLVDRQTDKVRPLFVLTQQSIRPSLGLRPRDNFRPHYYLSGQLLIFSWGRFAYACDLAQPNNPKLWEFSLLGNYEPSPGSQFDLQVRDDGNLEFLLSNSTRGTLGRIVHVDSTVVCILTFEKELVALHPRTGQRLWVKSGIDVEARCFGDGEVLYLVTTPQPREDKSIFAGSAIRLRDGVPVAVEDFGTLYRDMIRRVGTRLLLREPVEQEATRLYLRDLATATDVWSRTLPAQARLLTTLQSELVAIGEPDGQTALLDAESGQELVRMKLDAPLPPPGNGDVTVLLDDHYAYVVSNLPDAAADGSKRFVTPPEKYLRSIPVHGPLVAFDRQSGAKAWSTTLPPQYLIVEQFEDLPLILCASNQIRRPPANPNAGRLSQEQGYFVQAFDKRDGSAIEIPRSSESGFRTMLNLSVLQVRPIAGRVLVAGMAQSGSSPPYVLEFLTNGTSEAADATSTTPVGSVGIQSGPRRGGAAPGLEVENAEFMRRVLEAAEAARRTQKPPGNPG